MKIAIVGLGPTGLYTFSELVHAGASMDITIYDEGEWAGAGTPYSRQGASRLMLANIASIEIPALNGVSYLDWLKSCPPRILSDFGIEQDDLNERLFTPRLLIGCYYHNQLLTLQQQAEHRGYIVRLHEKTTIIDIAEAAGRFRIERSDGGVDEGFDRVIVATGHDFGKDSASSSYYPNPWCGLLSADVPAARIGIMGTSLSAIDACLAVVAQHGEFVKSDEGELTYRTEEQELKVSFMSRNGILPEADFYCPIPYVPTTIMTEASLMACTSKPNVLDAIFDLFAKEITLADPAYAARINLANLDADSFSEAYFAERMEGDAFAYARKNLAEVERNKAAKRTIEWRYAILRMHEQVEKLVPFFSDSDLSRFERGLKRVFSDNYAAVPATSIRRLLALWDANILDVVTLDDDYELIRSETTTTVLSARESHVFNVFIDARGQKALRTEDLKFSNLRQTLMEDGQDIPEVDEQFALVSPSSLHKRVYLAALPYLLHDRPFVQGIVSSAEIGATVAQDILTTLEIGPIGDELEVALQEDVIAA
ncbi:FAD/NAD(P)-binding protein [Rhizobium sp. FKY42]|uniref:FAD/NAD(P)-binding protein n=1 Tax=Rhizobium sp. FKY42 TaxID=2562310 RepID=UPI001485AFF8|nr:FAD/NAD(P)-binding protein [Rhizobium sp. FKY42]